MFVKKLEPSTFEGDLVTVMGNDPEFDDRDIYLCVEKRSKLRRQWGHTVFLTPADARELITALEEAIKTCEQ